MSSGVFLKADEVSAALARGEARGNLRMTQLCDSFPVLRNAPGTRPWDQMKFAKWASKGKTNAERQAAAFVLTVWNGHAPEDLGWWNQGPFNVGVFDVVHAFGCWDSGQKAAFLGWCQNPFWP